MQEQNNSRTRRSMLLAALGALSGVALTAVAKPSPVHAEGETIHVGDRLFDAESTTWLKNTQTGRDVLRAESTSSGRGLYGKSFLGTGVRGDSAASFGVLGVSPDFAGVRGTSDRFIGVWGECPSGSGVVGFSDTGHGLVGSSTSGVGVRGSTQSGYALEVNGRARMTTSGVVSIPAHATSAVIEPGVEITDASFVLLTPGVNLRGRDIWYSVSPVAGTITVHLSDPRSTPTPLSWLLLG